MTVVYGLLWTAFDPSTAAQLAPLCAQKGCPQRHLLSELDNETPFSLRGYRRKQKFPTRAFILGIYFSVYGANCKEPIWKDRFKGIAYSPARLPTMHLFRVIFLGGCVSTAIYVYVLTR